MRSASSGSGSIVTSSGNSCCSASCSRGLDLGLGDVAREDAGDADAGLMHVHHDGKRFGRAACGRSISSTQTTNSCVVKSSLCSSTRHIRGCSSCWSVRDSVSVDSRIRTCDHRCMPRDPSSSSERIAAQVGVESSTAAAHGRLRCRPAARPRPTNSRAPDLARAERRQVSVAIWQSISGIPQRSSWRGQPHDRDLRRVGARALNIDSPKNIRPMRHAVDAAGQLAVHPHLDRMGEAQRGQRGVGLDHLRRDPGAVLVAGRGSAQPRDHRRRTRVSSVTRNRPRPDALRSERETCSSRDVAAPCADPDSTTASDRLR